MTQRYKTLLLFICIGTCIQVNSAIHISPTGQGQALIFPYFSVANGLNTVVSINNNKSTPKAVKVNIREAKGSQAMYSFNLYLESYDIWTMGLVETNGFINLYSNDRSCVLNLDAPNQTEAEDWEWQTGMIEVIEMAGFPFGSDFFDEPGPDEENCNEIAEAWEDGGIWTADDTTQLLPVTGGLTGQATVFDVTNGFSFQVPSVTLGGFFAENSIAHFAPDSGLPNLSSGDNKSLVIYQGQPITTQWPTGYEAVSALLMKISTENEFSIEQVVDAKNEWVINFPTIQYHLANTETTKPFKTNENAWPIDNDFLDEDEFIFTNRDSSTISDREGFVKSYPYGIVDPSDPNGRGFAKILNSAVNTDILVKNVPRINDEFIYPDSSISGEVRGNVITTEISAIFTEDDDRLINFGKMTEVMLYDVNDRGVNVNDQSQQLYHGLPFIAFSYTQFTNASAQPGKLATYASVKMNHSEMKIE